MSLLCPMGQRLQEIRFRIATVFWASLIIVVIILIIIRIIVVVVIIILIIIILIFIVVLTSGPTWICHDYSVSGQCGYSTRR